MFLGRCSVAPMLDCTDRHCRYFHRLLTRHTLLYTEMITPEAILHGKRDFLAYSHEEQPLALQLGGNYPQSLAQCARQAQRRGYAEVNLNVGCPSGRVQQGRFGACLMAQASLVADCVKAMREQVTIPVTVKLRIGIDHLEGHAFLTDFIQTVAQQGGCDTFIIHARKAWLSGLSPKENREIPPLDYACVYQVKRDFPHLKIVLNGGVQTLAAAKMHLEQVDGVMIGREAYNNPALLTKVDRELFDPQAAIADPIAVVESLYPYVERALRCGVSLGHMTRPLLGLFHQLPGARQWRRHLSENSHRPQADVSVIKRALALVAAVI